MDRTVAATLAEFDGLQPAGYVALPCRNFGGAPTGDYKAIGAVRFSIGAADGAQLVERVARYWREQGFDVRPPTRIAGLPAAYATAERGYKLSVLLATEAKVELRASGGPCVDPVNDEEKRTPPPFKSLRSSR